MEDIRCVSAMTKCCVGEESARYSTATSTNGEVEAGKISGGGRYYPGVICGEKMRTRTVTF